MRPDAPSIMKASRPRAAALTGSDDRFTNQRQGSVRSSTYSNRISTLFLRPTASPHSRPSPPTVVQNPPIIAIASPTDINPILSPSVASPSSTVHEAPTAITAPSIATNPVPSAAEGITLRLAQIDAEPGEYWLVVRHGWEPWPAIICDEAMVKDFFKRRWKDRVNSRRSDGTWGKLFKSHGELVGERLFPALLLALNNW